MKLLYATPKKIWNTTLIGKFKVYHLKKGQCHQCDSTGEDQGIIQERSYKDDRLYESFNECRSCWTKTTIKECGWMPNGKFNSCWNWPKPY